MSREISTNINADKTTMDRLNTVLKAFYFERVLQNEYKDSCLYVKIDDNNITVQIKPEWARDGNDINVLDEYSKVVNHIINGDLLANFPKEEHYFVYNMNTSGCYSGNVLIGAKNAEEANKFIENYKKYDEQNVGNSFAMTEVDEDDKIEDVYADDNGILINNIIYTGIC